MKAYLGYFALGMGLSFVWITVADVLGIGPFSCGWWAGTISTTCNLIAMRAVLERQRGEG